MPAILLSADRAEWYNGAHSLPNSARRRQSIGPALDGTGASTGAAPSARQSHSAPNAASRTLLRFPDARALCRFERDKLGSSVQGIMPLQAAWLGYQLGLADATASHGAALISGGRDMGVAGATANAGCSRPVPLWQEIGTVPDGSAFASAFGHEDSDESGGPSAAQGTGTGSRLSRDGGNSIPRFVREGSGRGSRGGQIPEMQGRWVPRAEQSGEPPAASNRGDRGNGGGSASASARGNGGASSGSGDHGSTPHA